jgi:hypothetical protein
MPYQLGAPPGLRGYLMSRQNQMAEQQQQAQAVQQMIGLQGLLQKQQMAPLEMELMRAQVDAQRQAAQAAPQRAEMEAALKKAQLEKFQREGQQAQTQQQAQMGLAGLLSGNFAPNLTGVMTDENSAREAAIAADRAGQKVNIGVPNPANMQALSLLADPTGRLMRGMQSQGAGRGVVVPPGGAYIPPGATAPAYTAPFKPSDPAPVVRPVPGERPGELRYKDMRSGRDLGEAPGADQPKLKPGEMLLPDGRVELRQGSAEFVKQSGLHAKDYQAVLGVEAKTDNAVRKIDEILSPNKEGAFNKNFGGYNALVSQYLPGEAQNVRATIDSLKSDLKNAGLELMRMGGSIGQMTIAEWPIVERAIENITPLMSEKQARDAFTKVKSHMQRLLNNARDVYQTEWGQTQFYKNKQPKQDAPVERKVLKFDSQGNLVQ